MADLIIDTHVHPKMGAEALLAEMDEAGVDKAVILAVETDPEDLLRPDRLRDTRFRFFKTQEAKTIMWADIEKTMLQKLTPKVTNQVCADLQAAHPDRFIGFGSINLCKDPAYVEAKFDEILQLGLHGIKLLTFSQFFDPATSENFMRLCEWCEQTDRVILIHTGCGAPPWDARAFSEESHPDHLRPALERYHKVPIIMAHMGAYSKDEPGIWFKEALQLGKDYPNVWGDLGAVAWLVEREWRINQFRETMGFKQVLFASDYPAVANQVSISYMITLIKDNPGLTEDEKLDILGRNAARLFNLN